MKIINQPSIKWEKYFECFMCKTEAVAEIEDLRVDIEIQQWPDWVDKTHYSYYFDCPTCGSSYPVPQCDIPYIVIEKLRNKFR